MSGIGAGIDAGLAATDQIRLARWLSPGATATVIAMLVPLHAPLAPPGFGGILQEHSG